MTVLITLTTAGLDSGPFNLYSNLDGFVTPFQSSVSRSALLAGFSTSLVPDFTSTIRIKSTGVCTNYIDVILENTTTTTTSSSSTTTTTSIPLPTLINPNSCFPGSPSGEVQVSGATVGDVIVFRTYYSGMVGTDGASSSVSTHASFNGVSATPSCFAVNTGSHAFGLTVDATVTMSATTQTFPTTLFYRNGTSFTLFDKYTQIISYNGTVVSGNRLYTICSGNDSGPGC